METLKICGKYGSDSEVFYLDIDKKKKLFINYEYDNIPNFLNVTKEKAKEIIEFLTKFVEGE